MILCGARLGTSHGARCCLSTKSRTWPVKGMLGAVIVLRKWSLDMHRPAGWTKLYSGLYDVYYTHVINSISRLRRQRAVLDHGSNREADVR